MSTDLPNPDTTPTAQNPPSQPALGAAPRPRAISRAGVLVIVMALVVGAVAGGALASVTGLRVLPGPAARVVAPSTQQAATTTADAAVKDAIRRANDAQVQAFIARDATAMRASSTAQHYDELVRINDDLRRGGVTSIQLVSLRFGDVTVNGTTAQATTFETWRSTLADGTTDESTDRNDYTLVLQNGGWLRDGDGPPEAASKRPCGA